MQRQITVTGYHLTIQYDRGKKGKEGYEFVSDTGCYYDIDFEDASFLLFSGEPYEKDVKMLSLEVALGKPGPGTDPRIGPTLKDAVDRESAKNKNLVLSYICSALDQQQAARARKFGKLFTQENTQDEYIQIKISDGETYGGLIVHRDNPNLAQIKYLVT